MELLDDQIKYESDLTRKSIKTMFELRQACSLAVKKVNNARLALVIVCGLTLFSTIRIATHTDDLSMLLPFFIGVLVYGVLSAIPLRYAKYSLSIALTIYVFNFLVSLYFNPTFAILSLLIKGFIIYFIAIGLIAVFNIQSIQKKLLPYRYNPLSPDNA